MQASRQVTKPSEPQLAEETLGHIRQQSKRWLLHLNELHDVVLSPVENAVYTM